METKKQLIAIAYDRDEFRAEYDSVARRYAYVPDTLIGYCRIWWLPYLSLDHDEKWQGILIDFLDQRVGDVVPANPRVLGTAPEIGPRKSLTNMIGRITNYDGTIVLGYVAYTGSPGEYVAVVHHEGSETGSLSRVCGWAGDSAKARKWRGRTAMTCPDE